MYAFFSYLSSILCFKLLSFSTVIYVRMNIITNIIESQRDISLGSLCQMSDDNNLQKLFAHLTFMSKWIARWTLWTTVKSQTMRYNTGITNRKCYGQKQIVCPILYDSPYLQWQKSQYIIKKKKKKKKTIKKKTQKKTRFLYLTSTKEIHSSFMTQYRSPAQTIIFMGRFTVCVSWYD